MKIITFLFCAVECPGITEQPMDQFNTVPGAEVTISVTASGESLTYQWFKDDEMITDVDGQYSGATTSELTITDVQEPDDIGVYTCVVSNNACIMVTSDGANIQLCA